MTAAVTAAHEWKMSNAAEPEGWYRHIRSGRRRPDGDKTKEYVNP